ncbi:MAG: prepilin peptidase [Candidatus Omnitrophota bacterium]|jgi:leader peptidase (prepilin peptidase)/N-methyltransferase
MTLLDGGIPFLVIALGLCVGSFLNVCIHRMPKEESIVSPGSHCPACGKPVAWYDNVPLVSYLLLRGKCRQCGAKISPRYFVVELVTALLWFLLWLRFGAGASFAAGAVLVSVLLAVTMTDLETGLIPDKMTYPGMAVGLLLSAAFPALQHEGLWWAGLVRSLLGLAAGGGILLAVGFAGNLIFRKETMGGGDVKLLALIGAFVGWSEAIFVFLFAPIFAIPFALHAKFARKQETIPFGPYLALAGILFYFFGEKIMAYFFLTN